MHWTKIAKLLWASPYTALGLTLGSAVLLAGGSARWASGALEVTYRESDASCGKLARTMRFRGIVFGHVILAVTSEELQNIGPHERVHVEQYERWGPAFIFAYGASSAWQLFRARNPYWCNYFERQARELSKRRPEGGL